MNTSHKAPENIIRTKVRSDTLVPEQRSKVASKILRSADCYQQKFIKFDDIGIFHSYSELLHAALLEADSSVSTFTPQPYSLQVGKRRYIPDCYYLKSGKRFVVELKPRGEFNNALKIPLEDYFNRENINFIVVSNESVLDKEIIALNWLKIIRTLISAQDEDTTVEEYRIWDCFLLNPKQSVGDIISSGNRIYNREKEIALFRLIHKGKLSIHFNDLDLSYQSEVKLCN